MDLPIELQEITRCIRPLRDRIIVKRFEYENPLIAVVGVKLEKGVVVAAGLGRPQRRKVRFDQKAGHMSTQRALYFEDGAYTGKTVPMQVKVGDVVEFSPRNYTEVDFDKLGFPGAGKLLVVWEKACYGTTSDSKYEAMLWQQSAGYDKKGDFMGGAEEWQRA
jgi:co-chaperonin GroES (HSP10)